MSRILDSSQQRIIREAITATLDDMDINAEEAIPGLIGAIYDYAALTRDEEQALDEAANLLADGVQE